MVLRRGTLISYLLSIGSLLVAGVSPSVAAAADEPEAVGAEPSDAAEQVAQTEVIKENAAVAPDRKDHGGLFGPWRFGPTVQVGLPHPINYGLDLLYDKTFGFGFSTGKFKVKSKATEFQFANWDLRARWHPWQGSFFLGAAYGQQDLFLQSSQDLKISANGVDLAVPTTIQIDVKTNYLTPHLGWFSVSDWGFTIGFEIGAQIPLSTKDDLAIGFENVSASQEAAVKATDKYKDAKKKVDDASKLFGKQIFPYITLLRLGWLL